jgi:capsular exopolysaccharide synthesis family protein
MEPTLREQPDLRTLLRALWRRKWLFLGILISIPAVVYMISSLIPKTFEASTLLRVQAVNVNVAATTASPAAVETEALLFETREVAKAAAKELGMPRESAGSLLGSVRVQPVSTAAGGVTELIQLTAQAEEADRAAEIANGYADAIDRVRSRRALRQIDQTEASLEQQSEITTDIATKAELARQLQLLRGTRATVEDSTAAVTTATAPDTPVSPHPRRNTALAALVSLLLALGAVTIAERLDRRLRDPNELEPLLEAPLLSVIPRAAFPGAKPSPGPVREAFRTLASSLVYFNVDRPLSTVMVTSPTQGDGKTTVAVHLASALARDGQIVVLVDGDLRHPQVSVRLGIEPRAGVADVVTGQAELDDAIIDVAVPDSGDGRLWILGAGKRPPNPARLLGSTHLASMLDALAETADVVIIDTPPILNVSDAVPLLERVSGIVLVARVGQTGRDALLRTRQVIETAHGSILGAVATGAAEAGLYGYGTDYYEAEAKAEAAALAAAEVAQHQEAGLAAAGMAPEAGDAPEQHDLDDEEAAEEEQGQDDEEAPRVAASPRDREPVQRGAEIDSDYDIE